jgi:uroporphyrin-III C-methyltransferase
MVVPLLTSMDCTNQVHLVIGSNGIAAKRATRSHEAGANCVLLAPVEKEELHFDLKEFIERDRIKHIDREFQEADLTTFGRAEVDGVVDMVFVTLSPLDNRGSSTLGPLLTAVTWIASLCKRLRIPINCADSPTNCTFSLLSTHRDGPLQIGVSTSGKVIVPYCHMN